MARSPNFAERGGQAVKLLVLHYTGMQSGAAALARLCDPQAQVSAHYLIEESGNVHALVDEANTAWHAGRSFWRGYRNVNPVSVGIELVNPGHEWGYRAFLPAQMQALATLGKEIVARHSIEPSNVVGHSDIAPARKEDPGELFDWAWLAGQGVGLWSDAPATDGPALKEGDEGPEVRALQASLARYGYDVEATGSYDNATRLAALAFQRHFRSFSLTGAWDGQCQGLLLDLISKARL